ncbi:MAG: hypothetical protein CMK63_07235 [Pseudoalteromonadaceae bacterium]|nr:hypothetical protein [Gemmatimonadota bacterium]MBU76769.1 hypothetical protein [Pseudoalteromonadaceae bacterium]|tara:strand:- start:7631 stop:8053 length:423 start_codon:yes stop_codon:yes gene_type:complete
MNSNSILNAEEAPNCDVRYLYLAALNKAIQDSGYSRPRIADRMNDALAGDAVINAGKLNKWLAPSSEQSMPMEYLSAFCWAVGNVSIANELLKPILHRVFDERGQMLEQAARYQLEAQELQNKAQNLLTQAKADHPSAVN